VTTNEAAETTPRSEAENKDPVEQLKNLSTCWGYTR